MGAQIRVKGERFRCSGTAPRFKYAESADHEPHTAIRDDGGWSDAKYAGRQGTMVAL